MMKEKKAKRSAKFLEDGRVQICPDGKTVVVKEFSESMLADWPELAGQNPGAKPKAKRGSKVKQNDAEGHAQPGDGGDGI